MLEQVWNRRGLAAGILASVLGFSALELISSPVLAQPATDNEQIDVLTDEEKEATQGKPVADKPVADKPASAPAMTAREKAAADRAAARKTAADKARAEKEAARKAAAEKAEAERLAASLQMRVRITSMTPDAPVNVNWRYGGEALGGSVVSGSIGEAMAVGQWTPLIPFGSITKGSPRQFFLTTTASPPPVPKRVPRGQTPPTPGVPPRNVEFEFEFSRQGKVLKTVKAKGPDGATVGLVVPGSLIANGEADNNPQALDQLGSILDYATRRTLLLEGLPWAKGPTPKRFSLLTDLGGYGEGVGRGIRYTDPAVVDMEIRALRQLGVNSLRSMPSFVLEKMQAGEAYSDLNRSLLVGAMGMPVSRHREGRAAAPETGCPYGSAVPETTRVGVENALARLRELPAQEVWGLTDDEIGSVFDATPEGKSHMEVCPRCAVAYREWLQKQGLKPQDFGQKDWAAVRPVNLMNRRPDSPPLPDINTPGAGLSVYYTRLFNNYSTAKLFTPLRAAFDQANEQKKAAIAAGQLDSDEARQPWLYSFALRGNTFLMGGHSLDFFEFYRHADNAFVYETSNRDPRIWGWDSYLSDVGRVVSADQNLEFGIYVKPHRGAPLQRALSSISRGASMIYWYTYGPDYFKGDSFSTNPAVLETTSKAAHLIGRVEDRLENAQWVQPAEVAIIQPFSLMAWRNNTAATAAWEDNKWTYSALQHSHIPVDPIDEVMVVNDDISRYKVIYLPSPNLRRDAAAKLAQWVQAGGTLVTNAAGLSRDEANQPLSTLAPVLGLAKRSDAEMWFNIAAYGAGSIQNIADAKAALAPVPDGAVVTASKVFANTPLKLAMGREVLQPSANAEVLARYADGGVASTRHAYGKGSVYVNGFFPGLEYSVPVRTGEFDMGSGLSADTRSFISAPALAAGVRPVVDASAAVVEGILLKHPTSGARSVTLMNWGYRQNAEGRSVIKLENIKVSIRGAGPVTEVRSAWLDEVLPIETQGDVITVTLPSIEEGDVLLLK